MKSASRREPPDDSPIGELTGEQRTAVASVFESRAASELQIAALFASYTRTLIELDFDRVLVEMAADAVGDEVRHAALWRDLARRYAATSARTRPKPSSAQHHPGLSASEQLALELVAMSCINETIATARLEEMIWAARGDSLRQTLRTILADEVRHARVGWAFLASTRVSSSIRTRVSVALPGLLSASVAALLAGPEFQLPTPLPRHGIADADDTRVLFAAAVRDLLIPGLRHVHVDPTPAAEWLERFQTTHAHANVRS